MKKTIATISLLLSMSLIGVGVYGLTSDNTEPLNSKNVEWMPEWVPEIKIPTVNNTESQTPIDEDFENMEEFDITTNVDKKPTPDNITEGIVPIGEIKDDRGRLVEKGTNTNVQCNNLSPNTVYIPNIQLYSPISNEGNLGTFDKEGYFNLPARFDISTQWVDGAKITDKEGNTLLAAHRTYSGRYGVFNNLINIKEGSIACVSDSDGNVQKYVVESLKHYKKDALPQEIFENATTGDKRLTMITCAGTLVKKPTGGYTFDSNVIATFKAIK